MTQSHLFKVDKLIRDRLPNILREQGLEVFERILEQDEYIQKLKDKLLEEAQEVAQSTSKDEILKELADVLEVIQALARVHAISFTDVIEKADHKRAERGGFDRRIYNAFVEIPSGHSALSYYKDRPDQYPEVDLHRKLKLHASLP